VPEGAADESLSHVLERRLVATRAHLIGLAQALPRLPEEAARAADLLSQEMQSRSLLRVLVLVLAFLALGAGAEWAFRIAVRGREERALRAQASTARERVVAVLLRLAFDLAQLAVFGLGSIGAFLLFEWPPLLRRMVLAYLLAVLILRLALLASRFLLAPPPISPADAETYRILPLPDESARFWHYRVALFVGWLIFGWATVAVMRVLGFSLGGRQAVAYSLGIGLLAIALELVWRRPRLDAAASQARLPSAHTWLVSVALVLLWGLWVAGLMGVFWLAVVALLLPQALTLAKRGSRHLLRVGSEPHDAANGTMETVYLDRGLRAVIVAGAVVFLAWAWDLDLVELTSRDTLLTRLLRGVLSSIVILLVADLIWQLVKRQIDRRLAAAQPAAAPGSEDALRQARLRTLLPILRNAAFVVLATVAVLMALSALGVEIAPLIAGAGIVGVAVGFGSQTLVKDIISGVFYLLDDAFRVGEYIQSGSYKGTVESLGFRSVKLRHHRGYIYTVPYGQLGAVENMSRDWVIDKMNVNVTYDTDLDQAKKIIKQIGKELAQDPDFGANILEPLKMQGVEQFGDFAIQLRLKIMTRPGEQFVIRRKAYALIKKAFDEHGIRFAFPTVQVSGRETVEPAAARQALTLVKAKATEGGE
jgi:small-conductance mechanosensitive channel